MLGGHAFLLVAPKLPRTDTGFRRIDIAIGVDDDGRVASELHGTLFDGIGGLSKQQAADLRGTGEAQFADRRIPVELLSYLRRRACRDDVHDARRNLASLRELAQG